MSVDFKAKILLGVIVTPEQQNAINEVTNYEYEDWFHQDNHYDDVDYLIFGQVLECVPAGRFTTLKEATPEYIECIKNDIINALKGTDLLVGELIDITNTFNYYLMCEVS